MTENQAHSPKYWVVHKIDSDDVLVDTMSKSRANASTMALMYHNVNVEGDDNFEIILVKLVPVKL